MSLCICIHVHSALITAIVPIHVSIIFFMCFAHVHVCMINIRCMMVHVCGGCTWFFAFSDATSLF